MTAAESLDDKKLRPALTGLDHVGLSVADLDAQAAWYASALGLESCDPGSIPEFGIRVVFLADREHGWMLELLQREGAAPGLLAPDPQTALLTQGYGHICLGVDDLDTAYERLLVMGAESRLPPVPAPLPGVRIAYVADPEGNLIELIDRTITRR